MCGGWLVDWNHMEARLGARHVDDMEGSGLAGWRQT